LGSTRGLADSTGTLVGTFSYDAYGNLTSSTGTATTPFGYAGQYTDSESGLQYLRARYYDPQTAQFLTVDPLVGLTQQPYGYSGNNPTNASDPSGLATGGLCVGAAAAFGFHIGWQVCVQVAIPDSHSAPEVGTSVTVAGGKGTPSAGAYVQAQGSNAVHINDLDGWFGAGGASIGAPEFVGADGFVGRDPCDRLLYGGSLSFGEGGRAPLPAEVHGDATYTWTGPLPHLPPLSSPVL
jgi:RHS repeat-associated protein